MFLSPFDDEIGAWLDRCMGDRDTDTTGRYPVDIREDDTRIMVESELPGFSNEQIEVTYENGILSIIAQRKNDEEPNIQVHLNERRFTRVARSFKLPKTIDENKIDAKLAHGVLNLTLHKRKQMQPHRIDVNGPARVYQPLASLAQSAKLQAAELTPAGIAQSPAPHHPHRWTQL